MHERLDCDEGKIQNGGNPLLNPRVFLRRMNTLQRRITTPRWTTLITPSPLVYQRPIRLVNFNITL